MKELIVDYDGKGDKLVLSWPAPQGPKNIESILIGDRKCPVFAAIAPQGLRYGELVEVDSLDYIPVGKTDKKGRPLHRAVVRGKVQVVEDLFRGRDDIRDYNLASARAIWQGTPMPEKPTDWPAWANTIGL